MTEPFKPVGVTFLQAMAPYQAGDVAGLLHDHAHDLVRRRIADFFPPRPDTAVSAAMPAAPDLLDAMDRAELVAFGRDHLGMRDEPSLDITDAALREAIRANVDPALIVVSSDVEEAGGESREGGDGSETKGPASEPGLGSAPDASKQAKGGKPKP